jgi:hypothetical protein
MQEEEKEEVIGHTAVLVVGILHKRSTAAADSPSISSIFGICGIPSLSAHNEKKEIESTGGVKLYFFLFCFRTKQKRPYRAHGLLKRHRRFQFPLSQRLAQPRTSTFSRPLSSRNL